MKIYWGGPSPSWEETLNKSRLRASTNTWPVPRDSQGHEEQGTEWDTVRDPRSLRRRDDKIYKVPDWILEPNKDTNEKTDEIQVKSDPGNSKAPMLISLFSQSIQVTTVGEDGWGIHRNSVLLCIVSINLKLLQICFFFKCIEFWLKGQGSLL